MKSTALRNWTGTIIIVLLLVGRVAVATTPEKALCPVCALNGEDSPEAVAASVEFNGKMFHFCSQDCKLAFDEDPEAYLPPVFPRPAPAITATTLAGETVSLTSYRDKLVLVDFWATWCKPCEKGMPRLNKIFATYGGDAFTVVGISIDDTDERVEKVRRFIDKRDIDYPVAIDSVDDPAWAAYKVKVVPSLYLIDTSGQIVAQWIGNIDFADVEVSVSRMLAATE